MAIIKLGATIVGIRGTIGGITYSANRGGPYAKAWSTPPRAPTPKQSTVRSYPSKFALPWAALTPAQRTAWNTYAALPAQAKTNSLGQTYYASGWNWYVQTNSYCTIAGLALQVAPPANPTVGFNGAWPYVRNNLNGSPYAEIYTNNQDLSLTHYYAIWFAYVPNTTLLIAPKQYKLLVISLPDTIRIKVVTSQFVAIWGTPIIGWTVYSKTVLMSTTGRQTIVSQNSIKITA